MAYAQIVEMTAFDGSLILDGLYGAVSEYQGWCAAEAEPTWW
jgi:hypothetical protein